MFAVLFYLVVCLLLACLGGFCLPWWALRYCLLGSLCVWFVLLLTDCLDLRMAVDCIRCYLFGVLLVCYSLMWFVGLLGCC